MAATTAATAAATAAAAAVAAAAAAAAAWVRLRVDHFTVAILFLCRLFIRYSR